MSFFKLVTCKISGLFFLALLFLLFAGSNQALADISVSGNITTNTFWNDTTQPYVVTGNINIYNDATLTIAPGVEVFLDSGRQIYIGNSSSSTGSLVAQGTLENPIIFTGTSEAPWNYLYFGPYTGDGSILSHCVIENGGYSGQGMLYVHTDKLTIEHCTIRNSVSSGLYLTSNGVPALSENSYENNATYPIYVNTAESLSAIDSASSYTGDNDNRICVADHVLSIDATMADAGTPYFFNNYTQISNNATLTIQAGAELQFASNRYLYVGPSSNSTGRLVAEGTEENPITFTSGSDQPWYYLYFGPYTGDGSILSHCVIENGGYSGQGMLYVHTGNLTIEHCTIRNSVSSGLYLTANGIPALSENSYENNATYPIYVNTAESLSAIDSASSYTGDNDNRIYLAYTNFTSDTTMADAGTPYLFANYTSVYNNATLTIQSGAELQFESGRYLYIGNSPNSTGTLIAEGTADAPITFTSAQAAPQAGDWGGIYLYQYDGGSSLLNAVIEYGTNNINISGSSPVIEKCTIRYGSTSGIYIGAAVTPSIFCNTITANAIGISLAGNADPYLHDNDIYGNTSHGLYSRNYDTTVTAEDNWWGAAEGPGSEGADSVYNYPNTLPVDYTPWLTSSASCTVPLKASFSATPASGSEDLTVTFTDGSTGAAGAWKWDFDDGTTTEEQNPVHTFGEPGEYTVSLTVWELINGQESEVFDTTTRTITVNESVPTASFTPNTQVSGTPPLTVDFSDQSTVSGSEEIVSRAWDFDGDGTADSTEENPSRTFYEAGYHSVSLTVTDEDNDQDSMARENLIFVSDENPVAVPGGPYSGTEGHSILFDASGSYDPNQGEIVTYGWDFDNDGTIDHTTPSPTISHTYSQDSEEQNNGVYTATLTVTDEAGLSGSNSTTVTVSDTEPEIDFDADVTSGTAPLTVTFNDGSSSYDGIAGYIWNFGDNDTGTGENSEHTFTDAGTYTVTLTITEEDGDQKQLEKTGYITVQACTTYYLDADNDGYGTDDSQCLAAPTGNYTATQSGDCNDENPDVNPGAQEVCGDGIDNNCNNEIDEGCGNVDGDLDGDGDVDTADRAIFISALRKCSGDDGFNADADFDGDGCVTFSDYSYWLTYYRAYLSASSDS